MTESLVPWLSAAILAAGVFGALSQYTANIENTKTQHTLDYVLRYSSAEIDRDRSLLSERLTTTLPNVVSSLQKEGQSKEEYLQAYYEYVVCDLIAYHDESKYADAASNVLYYLDEGVICAEKGVCKEAMVRDLLQGFGGRFVRTYTPYFCHLRKVLGDDSIGERTAIFYNPNARSKAPCADYQAALEEASFSTCQNKASSSESTEEASSSVAASS